MKALQMTFTVTVRLERTDVNALEQQLVEERHRISREAFREVVARQTAVGFRRD